MKKNKLIGLTAAVLVVLSIIGYYSHFYNSNQEIPETKTATPEKKETIVWYTSVPIDTAEKIANAFELKYSNISVEIIRNSTFEISQMIYDEIEQKNVKADVLHVADIGIFIDLKNKDYLMEYYSDEYTYYPSQYEDEGYWAAMRVFAIGMAYDADRIKNPPQHWSDLLDSKWYGKIVLKDLRTAGSQYGEYYLLRELLGKEFWEKLSVQKPRIHKTYGECAKALLEGDAEIAMEFSAYNIYNYSVKKGTAIRGIYPSEGVPMIPCPVAILKDAPHPNTAKLFLDFALSLEGQEIFQRLSGAYSVRYGVEPLQGKPLLSDLNQLTPESWERYLAEREALVTEFCNLFDCPEEA